MGKVKAMMMDREERALDRGSADSYYGRSGCPHIWLDSLGQQVVEKSSMTQGEIAAYWEGYDNQIDRKDWGDDYDDSVL